MPPAGGFEAVKYKRNLPFRGPSGAVILAGVTAVCAYGFYRLGKGNLEKRELKREKTWSRIHLVPLLLAEGDRDAYRRQVAALEREKEIMKDVKGWEAGKSVYNNPRAQAKWYSDYIKTRPRPLPFSSPLTPPVIFPLPKALASIHPRSLITTPSRPLRPLHISCYSSPSSRRPPMPVSPIFRRDRDQDALALSLAASDMSLADHSPLMSFDDSHPYDYGLSDSTHMIFDFDDGSAFDSKSPITPWDPSNTPDYSISNTIPLFPASPESTSSELGNISSAHLSPSDRSFDPSLILSYPDVHHNHPHQQPHHHQQHHHQQQQQDFADNSLYSNWITDPDAQNLHHIHNTSAPIDIPTSHQSAHSSQLNSFVAYSDKSIFPDVSVLSPNTAFASLQPLPRSFSPSPQAVDTIMTDVLQDTSPMSPPDYTHSPPTWAQQLWSQPSQPAPQPDPSPLSSVPFPAAPEDAYATQRPRLRRDIRSVSQMWQSSSAPSLSHARPPLYSRAYSRRAESISSHQDDRDATIRTSKKRRSPAVEEEEARPAERERESPPLKSTLKPPKLAPSAWQLYFTDWIQRHQASSHKKLNVAQAAKEAGQEYARLSSEEKEPYKRRSLAAKEARERELAAYMRTLTPDDIKRENAFRTAQRKAGKSRKGNIKDPNAPKKPLSAYFMFLQRIRSDPVLVREVFGEETETTKQSVLAAAKWRSMTDDERKPFLAQAEQEKLEYEAARKLYEEGTTGYSSSINFSILPGSPINAIAFPSSSSSLSSSLSKLAASSNTLGAGNSMITTPMTMQGTLVKQEMAGSESESDGSGL